MKCPFWGICARTNTDYCKDCIHYYARRDYYRPKYLQRDELRSTRYKITNLRYKKDNILKKDDEG